MSQTATLIDFRSRPVRVESADDVRWTWESRCGLWRVVRRVSKYGLAEVYRAEHRDQNGWYVLSSHRKRSTAFAAVQDAAKFLAEG